MSKNLFVLLYHYLLIVSHIFVLYKNVTKLQSILSPAICFLHLTNITHVLICLYYVMAVLRDMKIYIKGSEKIFRYSLRQSTFLRFVLSVSILVMISFWVLYILDPRNLFNLKVKIDIPIWLPIFMHGGNTLILTCEFLISRHHSRVARQKIITTYTAFFAFYLCLQIVYHIFTQRHLYPFNGKYPFSVLAMIYTVFLFALCSIDFAVSNLIFETAENYQLRYLKPGKLSAGLDADKGLDNQNEEIPFRKKDLHKKKL